MNRSRFVLYIVLGVGLALTIIFFVLTDNKFFEEPIEVFEDVPSRIDVVFPNVSFNAEIVEKEKDLTRGLSGRDELSPSTAMLFVFNTPDQHGIWMKDMKFAIDIVWLDANKKVIHVVHQAPPESYPEVFSPSSPDLYVLEIPAGDAKKYDIKVGVIASFSY